MSNEIILNNVRMVTADEVVLGSMLIENGIIKAIDSQTSSLPQAQDSAW